MPLDLAAICNALRSARRSKRLCRWVKPLSCIPAVVMQKLSQGPYWTENPDHTVKTDFV